MCAKKETIEKVKSKKKDKQEESNEQKSSKIPKTKKEGVKKNISKKEGGETIGKAEKNQNKDEKIKKTIVTKKTVKKENSDIVSSVKKEKKTKKIVKTSKQIKGGKEKVIKIKNNEKKFVTVGKRKTSIARVFMQKGSGIIVINNKKLYDFFPNSFLNYKILQPLEVIKWGNGFDITVNVIGGGINSQAEAIKLGISKNLPNFNPDYKFVLRKLGFLTRDSRCVERKKFGHKKARRSFQFCKR